MTPHTILDSAGLDRTLRRLAHEVSERAGGNEFVLIGIQTRGVPLAERLAKIVGEIESREIPFGAIDVTLYRDDYRTTLKSEIPHGNQLPFSVDDKNIILVDDVLFTGRSVRAAIDELISFGRPGKIQLLVLIDRGHRQLPIRADYVGKNVPTSVDDKVKVKIAEVDGEDSVVLFRQEA